MCAQGSHSCPTEDQCLPTARPDTSPETEVEAGAGAEAEAGVAAEAGVEAGAGAEVEAGDDVGVEDELVAEVEAEAEAEAEAGTGDRVEFGAEVGAEQLYFLDRNREEHSTKLAHSQTDTDRTESGARCWKCLRR